MDCSDKQQLAASGVLRTVKVMQSDTVDAPKTPDSIINALEAFSSTYEVCLGPSLAGCPDRSIYRRLPQLLRGLTQSLSTK